MISTKDIIAAAKSITRQSQGIPDRKAIHPRRDWILGVGLFLVLVIGGSGWAIDQYYEYDTIAATVVAETPKNTEYRHGLVVDAIERFTQKEAAFILLENDRPAPPVLSATTTEEVAESGLVEIDTESVDSAPELQSE